jgi:hypothetical protein
MDGPRRRVPIASLWHALIYGLSPIWPTSRTSLGGVSLGDVWPCAALTASLPSSSAQEGDDLVPFHKLTGWITYSLIEPMQKILGWEFESVEDMMGLPEYRNGKRLARCENAVCALTNVISRRPSTGSRRAHSPSRQTHARSGNGSAAHSTVPPRHRRVTVIELSVSFLHDRSIADTLPLGFNSDRIADLIRQSLGLTAQQLTLAQVLESATWKGGREIAKVKRPETGGPPIDIESDGTVF